MIIRSNRDSRIVIKKRTTPQTVNNSAVLQNDDTLVIPIAQNEICRIDLVLGVISPAAADLKIELVCPVGASGAISIKSLGATVGGLVNASIGGVSTIGTEECVYAFGYVVNGITAGDIQLQWAQNTQTVGDTQLLAGSSMVKTRL